MKPPEWAEKAACRGVPLEVFFPDVGCGSSGNPSTYYEARSICVRCTVRSECLEQAMADEDGQVRAHRSGMWGGLSPSERAELARERRKAVA